MLFLMVLITVALVVVQEMSARLGAYTGEGLVSLIREQFSLRIGTFAVVCLLVANLAVVPGSGGVSRLRSKQCGRSLPSKRIQPVGGWAW